MLERNKGENLGIIVALDEYLKKRVTRSSKSKSRKRNRDAGTMFTLQKKKSKNRNQTVRAGSFQCINSRIVVYGT